MHCLPRNAYRYDLHVPAASSHARSGSLADATWFTTLLKPSFNAANASNKAGSRKRGKRSASASGNRDLYALSSSIAAAHHMLNASNSTRAIDAKKTASAIESCSSRCLLTCMMFSRAAEGSHSHGQWIAKAAHWI